MPLTARLDPEQERLILDLTAKGVRDREIAEQAQCSRRTVTRARRRLGAPRRSPYDPITEEEAAFILYLLEDECPYTEVARTVNRDHDNLRRRFPGYGLQDPGASFAYARMVRDFERLLVARGIADREE